MASCSRAPLFLMEKMPAGFSYVTGDWRYIMIMPDGSLFGETRGDGAVTLEDAYCFGNCALAPAAMVDGRLIGRVDAKTLTALVKP